MYNETMNQGLAVMDVLNTGAVNNTTAITLGIDMSKVKRVQYLVLFQSSVAGTGTLDGRLQGSANSNFTGNTNITGTNITQMTANGTIGRVEIRADQLQAAVSGYRYVRLHLTAATNAVTCQVVGLGGEATQKPASAFSLNSTFMTTDVSCSI